MTASQPSTMQRIFSRNMLICIFTGFTSGLPLYFLYSLIPAWLRSEHVDLKTIGLFALIGFSLHLEIYLVSAHGLCTLAVFRFAARLDVGDADRAFVAFWLPMRLSARKNILSIILGLSLVVAFFSASQDIVVDAFRREVLSDEELVLGNSLYVNAYRISSLIPASLSLILADRMPWSSVFIITALFMVLGLLATLFVAQEPARQPVGAKGLKIPLSNRSAISLPVKALNRH